MRYKKRCGQVLIRWCILLCALASWQGCGPDSRANYPAVVSSPPERETAAVVCRQEYVEVHGIGVVQAYAEVGISSEIAGTVLQVHCQVGDGVADGDVLLELASEARRIAVARRRAELQKAEARFRKSIRDMRKAESLFGDGVMSDSAHDDAGLDRDITAAELALARSNLEAAEKDLRDTRLCAPFAGSIALKSVEIGDYVTPGTALVTLVSIERVKVVLHVSEMDIPHVQIGGPVRISIDSLGSALCDGIVETIALKADETTRAFAVETVVDNPGYRILPGMVARVAIRSLHPTMRCMVPARALRSMGDSTYVRLVTDNGTVQRPVRLGAPRGDHVIVLEGLQPGESIVLDPALDI